MAGTYTNFLGLDVNPVQSVTGAFGSFGSAVSDLYASQGDTAEAGQYASAYNSAVQAEMSTYAVGAIKEQAQVRQGALTLGTTSADIAANGLQPAGSAMDILTQNKQQAGIQDYLVNLQTQNQAVAYAEQANADYAMEQAAKKAASGSMMGALFQGASGIASLAMLIP